MELACVLLEQGVGVEAGLASAAAGRVLVQGGVGDSCLRVLLEGQRRAGGGRGRGAPGTGEVMDPEDGPLWRWDSRAGRLTQRIAETRRP